MKAYELSKELRDQLSQEISKAPSKQIFHAYIQRAIFPDIKGTTILHKNNDIEIYHYETKNDI